MRNRLKFSRMTKRISVTLPDLTHQQLQEWAETEGTSLSDLAGYVIRKAVDEALESGKINPKKKQ